MTLTVHRSGTEYRIHGQHGSLLAVSPDRSSAWIVLFSISLTEHEGRCDDGAAWAAQRARELLDNADAVPGYVSEGTR